MQPDTDTILNPQSQPQKKKSNALLVGLLVLVASCVIIIGLVITIPRLIIGPLISNIRTQSLHSVHMISASEGWAVGVDTGLSQPIFKGLILHYDKGHWQRFTSPVDEILEGVWMIAPDEGWIASNGDQFLRYQGGNWVATPSPAGEIYNLSLVSKDEGWAVGNRGVLLHYTAGRWTKGDSPTSKELRGIYMLSSGEGWAVGGADYASEQSSTILHYYDGIWTIVDNPTNMELYSVFMTSADEGWAVGGRSLAPINSVILHYRSGTWQAVASPTYIPLKSVYMVSPSEGWAVGGGYYDTRSGENSNSSGRTKVSVILHYINGKWEEVESPVTAELNSIYMLSADEGWIVGDIILHYQQGKWQQVQIAE